MEQIGQVVLVALVLNRSHSITSKLTSDYPPSTGVGPSSSTCLGLWTSAPYCSSKSTYSQSLPRLPPCPCSVLRLPIFGLNTPILQQLGQTALLGLCQYSWKIVHFGDSSFLPVLKTPPGQKCPLSSLWSSFKWLVIDHLCWALSSSSRSRNLKRCWTCNMCD